MIIATLTNGRRVELKKDCGCQTHDGPCWLHEDDMWHRANRNMLDRGGYLGVMGFAHEEIDRLKNKEIEMVSRGIVGYEIVEPMVDIRCIKLTKIIR